jgi:hypothetical protein
MYSSELEKSGTFIDEKAKTETYVRRKSRKKRRRREYVTVLTNGKQKRIKRPPSIEGLALDEFIRKNADPAWLFQNEMFEELYQWEKEHNQHEKQGDSQQPSGYDFKTRPPRGFTHVDMAPGQIHI